MNRFNLSFNGEIQPGFDQGQVKARFGKLFGIDDPVRLERFFTGDTIILRRNLDRKTAAEYYSKLRKLGVAQVLARTEGAPRHPLFEEFDLLLRQFLFGRHPEAGLSCYNLQ